MDTQIFTAICSVICALIAAFGASWKVSRNTNTQIALMQQQINQLEKMVEELRNDLKDHSSLLGQLGRIETRLDTVEKEIEELRHSK